MLVAGTSWVQIVGTHDWMGFEDLTMKDNAYMLLNNKQGEFSIRFEGNVSLAPTTVLDFDQNY